MKSKIVVSSVVALLALASFFPVVAGESNAQALGLCASKSIISGATTYQIIPTGSRSCQAFTYQNGDLVSKVNIVYTASGLLILTQTYPYAAEVTLQIGKTYGSDMTYGCNWTMGCYISLSYSESQELAFAFLGGATTNTVFAYVANHYGWWTAEVLDWWGLITVIASLMFLVVGYYAWICPNGIYFYINSHIGITCNGWPETN